MNRCVFASPKSSILRTWTLPIIISHDASGGAPKRHIFTTRGKILESYVFEAFYNQKRFKWRATSSLPWRQKQAEALSMPWRQKQAEALLDGLWELPPSPHPPSPPSPLLSLHLSLLQRSQELPRHICTGMHTRYLTEVCIHRHAHTYARTHTHTISTASATKNLMLAVTKCPHPDIFPFILSSQVHPTIHPVNFILPSCGDVKVSLDWLTWVHTQIGGTPSQHEDHWYSDSQLEVECITLRLRT